MTYVESTQITAWSSYEEMAQHIIDAGFPHRFRVQRNSDTPELRAEEHDCLLGDWTRFTSYTSGQHLFWDNYFFKDEKDAVWACLML